MFKGTLLINAIFSGCGKLSAEQPSFCDEYHNDLGPIFPSRPREWIIFNINRTDHFFCEVCAPKIKEWEKVAPFKL